ncbi:hypothetical protein FACS189440_07250 [Bacteroidia bacterium]|nr:hypothetical protein FACS189440_07250 [Bacteroidia bacterium]
MLLSFLGVTTSMNAQVRIGGTADPDGSALLDVNKTDDPNPAGNLGLGLPRVELTSATQPLATGNTPKPGTMVYNTGSALDGAGVYYWATNAWAKLSSGVGPAGPKGDTGATGPQGPKGDTGASATAGTLATTATGLATIGTPTSTNAAIQLHNVARTGSYNDLLNKPTIPTAVAKSTTIPLVAGTAAVGNETAYAAGNHVHPAQTSVSGNAGTATTLATARTIAIAGTTSATVAGVTGTATSFNGGANISIPATVPAATTTAAGAMTAADKTKLNAIATGATANAKTTLTPLVAGTAAIGSDAGYAAGNHVHPAQTSVTGNAGTATKLATARAITLTGNVTGTANFDGSAAASIATTLADNAVTSAKIANGAVALDDLAANSVNSSKIVDGSVTSADIADATIVNADIANATIAGGKLVTSIALAGSPTTTTQATATDNTTIATTAFVKAALNASGDAGGRTCTWYKVAATTAFPAAATSSSSWPLYVVFNKYSPNIWAASSACYDLSNAGCQVPRAACIMTY